MGRAKGTMRAAALTEGFRRVGLGAATSAASFAVGREDFTPSTWYQNIGSLIPDEQLLAILDTLNVRPESAPPSEILLDALTMRLNRNTLHDLPPGELGKTLAFTPPTQEFFDGVHGHTRVGILGVLMEPGWTAAAAAHTLTRLRAISSRTYLRGAFAVSAAHMAHHTGHGFEWTFNRHMTVGDRHDLRRHCHAALHRDLHEVCGGWTENEWRLLYGRMLRQDGWVTAQDHSLPPLHKRFRTQFRRVVAEKLDELAGV